MIYSIKYNLEDQQHTFVIDLSENKVIFKYIAEDFLKALLFYIKTDGFLNILSNNKRKLEFKYGDGGLGEDSFSIDFEYKRIKNKNGALDIINIKVLENDGSVFYKTPKIKHIKSMKVYKDEKLIRLDKVITKLHDDIKAFEDKNTKK